MPKRTDAPELPTRRAVLPECSDPPLVQGTVRGAVVIYRIICYYFGSLGNLGLSRPRGGSSSARFVEGNHGLLYKGKSSLTPWHLITRWPGA